jgi:hypothetical protein
MVLVVTFRYFLSPVLWYAIFVVGLAGVGTFLDIIARRIMR